jgi:hypothetical protein
MSFSNLPRLGLAAAALTAGSLASPRQAMADGPLVWNVVIDVSCGSRGRELAREVGLACDAVGHSCRVASGAGAERRAVVACPSEAQWTLEAQSATGAHLWTVALDGRLEGRLRTGAMWIARAEPDAPPPDAPVISAPEPPHGVAIATPLPIPSAPQAAASAPAAASSAPAIPPPAASSLVAVNASSVPPGPAAAPTTRDPDLATLPLASSRRQGGLAVAVRGSVAGGLAPASLGGSARAVLGLPMRANLGLVLAGDQALGAGPGFGLTTARAGASLGWGAPWSRDGTLGASVEVGPVFGVVSGPSDAAPGSRGFVDAYAQLSVYGCTRSTGSFRPWIALAVAALAAPVQVSERAQAVASPPRVSGIMDVGVAWAGW